MRRGFKADAERTAVRLRSELGLDPVAPLDPWQLAEHLGIRVLSTRELICAPHEAESHEESISYFSVDAPEDFSALTADIGSIRTVVLNSAHSRARQASSLAHELAHTILGHKPRPAFGPGGCRACDHQEEEEADWLGWVLLVPCDAALLLVRENVSLESAAQRYGTSVDVMRMRINTSGARIRFQRQRVSRR